MNDLRIGNKQGHNLRIWRPELRKNRGRPFIESVQRSVISFQRVNQKLTVNTEGPRSNHFVGWLPKPVCRWLHLKGAVDSECGISGRHPLIIRLSCDDFASQFVFAAMANNLHLVTRDEWLMVNSKLLLVNQEFN